MNKGVKNCHPLSICADCGATGPSWASINRGILICSDCCSVHRSLGRHISHVKCLRQSNWIPEQLTMVQSLYSCGANSIWEYGLLNPEKSDKKVSSTDGTSKPTSSDPLHPVKSNFIRAKHVQLSFVYKPSKDDPPVSESELSRQLHSSVRTPNLETSLRLLSQGADPNYYHPEKNSTPLMVAGRAGQAGQVELLLVYGADPGAVDKMGKSASDYAKTAGHLGVSQRLISSQFELSDRLTYFLCQKKPDHNSGQHFLIPEHDKGFSPPQTFEAHRVAKRKLQGLSNGVFEELAIDVYDEIDRRETDAIWIHTIPAPKSKSVIIPFLPVNPDYGTTRNQGRQKLARLNNLEFTGLVIDVLKEIRRRQTEMNAKWPLNSASSSSSNSPLRSNIEGLGSFNKTKTRSLPLSMLSDDEPIYDNVASDDDYYQVPSRSDEEQEQEEENNEKAKNNKNRKPATTMVVNPKDFLQLKTKLESSEQKVQRLLDSNDDMRNEIARLTSTVNQLILENQVFGNSGSPNNLRISAPSTSSSSATSSPRHKFIENVRAGTVSMYEQPSRGGGGQGGGQGGPSSLPPGPPPSMPYLTLQFPPSTNPYSRLNYDAHPYYDNPPPPAPTHYYSTPSDLPNQEEVVRRTEAITRCIQELLISAKDEEFEAFIPCSERIVRAVTDMVVLFPDDVPNARISNSLSSLTAAATHFETECRALIHRSQKEGPLNSSFVTQQVIQCAFDIAKSTKQLVALFQ